MEIGNTQRTSSYGLADRLLRPEQEALASKAAQLKAQNESTRSDILGNQKSKAAIESQEGVDFVREHGFQAYAEQVRKEKLEEMRAEILEAMGLTEEDLSNMSGDQRRAIEDSIAQEINMRLAAASLVNKDEGGDGSKIGQMTIGNVDPENLLAAQITSGGSGAFLGLLANQQAAEERRDPARLDENKDQNDIV